MENEEKKVVRITDNYSGKEKYFALTKDQIRLLKWLDTESYLHEDIHVKFDVEIPDLTEI